MEEEEDADLIRTIKDAVLTPINLLLSRPARRAYLSSFLFLIAGLTLLGIAVTAYIVFYYSYIPTRGFSRAVHLQFDPARSHHPYGVVSVGRELASAQPYDVHVILNLPRTPSNRLAGNFMLDLRLLAPGSGAVSAAVMEAVMGDAAPEVLVHARRPAILTYYSPIMEYVNKALQLPWYLLGWRKEAEVLRVDLLRDVEFPRGWRNIPATARLELSSDTKMQVYDATLIFSAQFRGLRYLMYNYRLTCFILFTATFWTAELISALLAWLILSQLISSPRPAGRRRIEATGEESESVIKTEAGEEGEEELSEGLSDTERTFPTYSRQPPLRYSSPKVKEEKEEKGQIPDVPVAGVDADDEDEDADFLADEPAPLRGGLHSDSGLGTSLESSGPRREAVRRRRSGGGDFHET